MQFDAIIDKTLVHVMLWLLLSGPCFWRYSLLCFFLTHTLEARAPKLNSDSCSSKHEKFTHCWYKVGPASQTVGQHCTNNGQTSRVCWGLELGACQWY